MSGEFEEVARMPICLEKGKKYQVEIQGNEVVISKRSEWEDITAECILDFRYSCHCSGRYIAVMHIGKLAAVIGYRGIQSQSGFKVDMPPGASMSFRILKKNR